ncbi:MAG TPA: chromosome segregation protein SMC, partial [Geobacterales bacterium]|nr:chromosome segregation protein SMC [Geobacterales bacterium]
MKITRLEIVGFKSFVDKVVLTFPEGITSIVGPNGCGKSNVVDALRWVMGEQSAKNLRGASMDDVIFVGSDSRKPVGMAEVSIVFSTDDGQVPAKYLNFHEIQVTRRLYRDGDSEYLINKAPCRLLDITELFMDTGVGTKAYSVIEQGKIGMILHSKPEERRFIIEEAAGISKYKARKKVALRKMEVTRQNLLRLSDIISEIRRQMAGVQRQAKKAESFKLYREELKEIELAAAFHEYLSLREEQQRLGGELDRLRIDEERLASQVAQGELTIESSRLQLLEEEQAVTSTQELLFQQRGEVASFESRLEFRRKELANLQRLLERLGVESEEGERRRGEAEEEIEGLEMEAQRLTQELSDSEEQLAQGEERLSLLASAEIAKSQQLEEQRRQLFGVMSEVAASSNQHAAALKKISALDERFERGRRESIAIGERLAESSSKSMQQDASMELLRQQRRDQDADINRFTQRVEEARLLLAGLEKELLSRRDELGRSDSRLHSLREMTSQYAGTGEGVRSVLRAPRFHERFPGLVADLLQTSPELEGVLETLLAERLSFIVAERHEDAAEAIDFLVENRGGRGTFIVSDAPHPLPSPSPAGTLPLLEAVTVDKRYHPLLALLLANCYVAEDLSTAHKLSLKYPAATFVTRRGEVVAPGGIVSGGAGEDGGEGEIHLRREIRELAERVAFLSGELQQLEEQRTSAKDLLAQGEEEVRSARQRLHESDLAIVNAEKDLQRHRDEERHLAERQEIRTLEDEQLQEERESLLREAEAAVTRQQELLASREGTEKSVSDAEGGLEAIRNELDQAREEVTVAKVRAASLGQKRDENGRLLARTRALIDELLSRQGKSGSDLAAASAERDLLQQQLEGSDDELRRLMRQLSDTEVVFARVKARHDGVAEQLREGELTLRRT